MGRGRRRVELWYGPGKRWVSAEEAYGGVLGSSVHDLILGERPFEQACDDLALWRDQASRPLRARLVAT